MKTLVKKALISGAAAATIAGFASSAAFAWDGNYSNNHHHHKMYDNNNCYMMSDRYDSNYWSDGNGCHHMMYSSYNDNNYRHHDYSNNDGCGHDGYSRDNSY